MKSLSIATAGAALIALGAASLAPSAASAATIGFTADISGTLNFNPIVNSFLPQVNLPPLPPSVTFLRNLSGSVPVDNPQQYASGNFTIPSDLLNGLLNQVASPSEVALVNATQDVIAEGLLNVTFQGTGLIASDNGSTTSYSFNYDPLNQSIVANNFSNASVLVGCLSVNNCENTASANVLAIAPISQIFPTATTLASGQVNFDIKTSPNPKPVPEPNATADVVGFAALGAGLLLKKKMQKKA